MSHFLDNPVYYALLSGDAHLGSGNERAKYFDEQVSPFAGFHEEDDEGFFHLYKMLPAGRNILYATRNRIHEPAGWRMKKGIPGRQFIFLDTPMSASDHGISVEPLQKAHVEQMIALTTLTRPGPFSMRTLEFGHYYGIFDQQQLVAMTGQRLHPANFAEISAVCTHPEYLGKGYAAALIQHQLHLICHSGQIPFLHVRDDNDRAIALYLRLGFEESGLMNFYFLEKK